MKTCPIDNCSIWQTPYLHKQYFIKTMFWTNRLLRSQFKAECDLVFYRIGCCWCYCTSWQFPVIPNTFKNSTNYFTFNAMKPGIWIIFRVRLWTESNNNEQVLSQQDIMSLNTNSPITLYWHWVNQLLLSRSSCWSDARSPNHKDFILSRL